MFRWLPPNLGDLDLGPPRPRQPGRCVCGACLSGGAACLDGLVNGRCGCRCRAGPEMEILHQARAAGEWLRRPGRLLQLEQNIAIRSYVQVLAVVRDRSGTLLESRIATPLQDDMSCPLRKALTGRYARPRRCHPAPARSHQAGALTTNRFWASSAGRREHPDPRRLTVLTLEGDPARGKGPRVR